MASLDLVGITKKFGQVLALDNLHLCVPEGELLVMLGPRGCCKSTILRMIAGLVKPSSGDILLDGVRINNMPTHNRNVAMVFEQYALYPHMTVGENIGYALKVLGIPLEQRSKLIRHTATELMVDDCLGSKPADLTQSQIQCVVLARSLVRNPNILLLDGPARDLDMNIRSMIHGKIKQLVKGHGTTTIYVTHNQMEAMHLGDRLCIINSSRIQQIADATEVYDRPANAFVASFIGELPMNMVEGTLDVNGFINSNRRLILKQAFPIKQLGPAILGVRPEDMIIAEPEQGMLRGTIMACSNIGDHSLLNIDICGEYLLAKTKRTQKYDAGNHIGICMLPHRLHFFSSDGSKRID